jgi:hypothetical protein
MSLLNELGKREVWNDFRNYRTTRNQLSLRESRQLDVLIEHEGVHGYIIEGVNEEIKIFNLVSFA